MLDIGLEWIVFCHVKNYSTELAHCDCIAASANAHDPGPIDKPLEFDNGIGAPVYLFTFHQNSLPP